MVSDTAILRGFGASRALAPAPGPPLLLERKDPDFLGGLLADVVTPEPLVTLSDSMPSRRGDDGVLELYQPVHRAFHLAVVEVVCDAFGQPRLDASKIESAGLVVRRVVDGTVQGWMRQGATTVGWVDFPASAIIRETTDPDPARRPDPMVRFGLPPRPADKMAESVSSLFKAPPTVCDTARRTILFGVLPLASSEVSDTPLDKDADGNANPPYTLDEITDPNHLPPYFQAGTGFSLGSAAGRVVTAADAEAADSSDPLAKYLLMVRQLDIEFDAFNPEKAESLAIVDALKSIVLRFSDDPFQPDRFSTADIELERATEVLVLRPSDGESFRLPLEWPAVSADVANKLATAIQSSLNARIGDILPREGRYDDPDAIYHVRAFVRVRRDDGCAPAIYWSKPSEPFRILSWFENGAQPPPKVALPKLDRDSVKKLKPNVTFKVPSKIFNMLNQNKPKDFIDGKGTEGTDSGIDWICGFNIPIITLCAFIVLFIFLVLLNIIFWWLPFIKICFPIPSSLKKKL
jgi:hypothetical protein